jgi:putative N-acetyltransferase (TIGR04045 family)
MIFDSYAPYRPCEFQVKFATCAWERDQSNALRRDVFCKEQSLFDGDDRDDIDNQATAIVATSMLGFVSDKVVGTVRIHEEAPGVWWGSRLAVHSDYRKIGALGSALIRVAVRSAHAMGCHTFLAHVQSQNALLFRRLHWAILDEIELHGRPHFRMKADLNRYPPMTTPDVGLFALARRAA